MKKAITIIIITLLGISQIPVTTTFEDGSTYQETLASHLVYKYIQVPSAHLKNQ
ncbi:hypothetical protein J5571_00375 [Streptococcus suis]|uniref:hypothetical protein n=1 Tax=Streptococcus suis TaxID=1307 RepID=UPI001379B929|nr:hypothetical protein [Streptococcus suis]MBO4114998.1 hypothetical protein [Streptococcus suis]MBO4117116.1 hypothetical protein [Streptococcus suis]MBO4124397.1 hypothetical protein [Streptococcus suis]MBO4128189.1 hypothetical protein [Streptococcus suis]MCE6986844.1 hypothetical protein [Streptococcus suis]